ncbi:hypothetical protein QUF80_01020 [Desulfococcaceae bacterium HSG8]|nr:hypothetical protein [Desulfococcaceae bacterium HSG8]
MYIKNKKIIKYLKAEREVHIKDARDSLKQGDLARAKENLEWIDISSQLIPSQKNIFLNKTIWIIGLLVLSLCIPMCNTRISFKAVAENATLMLNENWSLNQRIMADSILIHNVVALSASNLDLPDKVYPKEKSYKVYLKGKGIIIENLSLPKDSEIRLDLQRENKLRLFAWNSLLKGELSVCKADIIIETEDGKKKFHLDSDIPEPIRFCSAKMITSPVRFEFVSKENHQLYGFQTQAIKFLEEYPPDSGKFESVIRSGEVTILKTGFTKKLKKLDQLRLEGLKTHWMEVLWDNNGITIFFDGTCKRVFAGPKGFEENMTLTLFEYGCSSKALRNIISPIFK